MSQASTNPVLASAEWVVSQARYVHLDHAAIEVAAGRLMPDLQKLREHASSGFDTDLHYVDGGPLTAQYLLVVDALNFCFWPDREMEYEHLARGLKNSLANDEESISAERLGGIDGAGVRALLGWHRDLPQQEERARLLREVGNGLLRHFGGQAAQLVAAADGSALRLVELITAHFPGFRDHGIYAGRQVFFHKRAQIYVGDLHGAFGGQGLGAFHDIGALTMFADYRVPVVLRLLGVLTYEEELARKIENHKELPAGGQEEMEIRAASIVAVEQLRDAVNARLASRAAGTAADPAENGTVAASEVQQQPPQQPQPQLQQQQQQQQAEAPLLSIQLDWWLWEQGERMRATDPPHHRCMTIYY